MSAGESVVLITLWQLAQGTTANPWNSAAAMIGASSSVQRHNKTALFVYVIQWCDHGGDFN